MKIIYTEYFQKSKVFLYPLLSLKKGISYVPNNTYISWDNYYTNKDCKLICVYDDEMTSSFRHFESLNLLQHPMLFDYYNLESKSIYVFDLSQHKHDFSSFIEGYYSKFSLETKKKILNFFGNTGNISKYIESFLNPEEYHEQYSESLNVDINIIKDVYEVCSKPDMEKETLYQVLPKEIEFIKNFKK